MGVGDDAPEAVLGACSRRFETRAAVTRGWSAAGLGEWKRTDKLEQDSTTSDGYGTGFSIFILRRTGVEANDPAIQKGITWLKTNQRESGRWFTRSLNRDNKHYLTHVGSAFSVMAIQSCQPAQSSASPGRD